ncbi:acyltransferase family protein [Sphingomonas sp. KR1UV-12]|uniref:Acyltransferase family protein n=1 Tax=Sphingomonas aurea TaxID=3063994 RepID=A0ABT9EMK2_9SPHN|nr:acyltransferase family protein [Sphingomonas sp. KR1UV-12]MDP1027878.1 acyltransferase family protein [Sphingomonas sp. KR1UV-12]
MSAATQGRIEGLVAWRALLMLGGLLLHATMGREDYAPFAAINIVSGSFRMGTFFMISGLLTGFALTRHPDGPEWVTRRLLQLAVPTLVGLAVICPVVRMLLVAGEPGSTPPLSVYHLWFMVALMHYTGIAWLVARVDRRWPLFRRVESGTMLARLRQSLLLVAVGTLAFLLMVETSAATAWLDDQGESLLRHLPLVVGYAPLFLLGLACGQMPTLRRILTGGVGVPAAIIAVATMAHLGARWWLPLLRPEVAASAEQLLLMAGAAWCPPAATALILRSALAIRRVPVVLAQLSDASLTMYLLHYPLMLAARLAIAPLAPSPWTGFAVMLVAGGSLSYLIHRRVVLRVPLVALLLTGRWPRRSTALQPVTV